jgi:hypothetical protein
MLIMHMDADDAISQIEFIVGLAMQVDDLESDEALRVRAEISVRIRALQMVLLEDEAQLRMKGYGDNVPLALDEIARARSALSALERAVEDRLDSAKSNALENAEPATRWAS